MNCSVAAKLERNLKVNTTTHHSSKSMCFDWMIGLFCPTLVSQSHSKLNFVRAHQAYVLYSQHLFTKQAACLVAGQGDGGLRVALCKQD